MRENSSSLYRNEAVPWEEGGNQDRFCRWFSLMNADQNHLATNSRELTRIKKTGMKANIWDTNVAGPRPKTKSHHGGTENTEKVKTNHHKNRYLDTEVTEDTEEHEGELKPKASCGDRRGYRTGLKQ